MKNLKNKIYVFIFIFSLSGCKTKDVFEIKSFDSRTGSGELHILTVKSDHVKQECIFLNAEDENKWRHQYMMYILNSNNEVIPVMYSVHQEKSVCLEHLKKVEKILKKYPQVKMCLREKIEKDSTSNMIQNFEIYGSRPVKFEMLTFDSICSSGECYTDNAAWKETCPGFKKN